MFCLPQGFSDFIALPEMVVISTFDVDLNIIVTLTFVGNIDFHLVTANTVAARVAFRHCMQVVEQIFETLAVLPIPKAKPNISIENNVGKPFNWIQQSYPT